KGAVAVDRLRGGVETGGGSHLILVEQRGTGNQRGELQVVASVQRKVLHLLGIHLAGEFRRDDVDRFAGSRNHVDGLRSPARLQDEIHREAAVADQDEACSGLSLESLQIDTHGIGANRKVGGDIIAAAVGSHGVVDGGFLVHDVDLNLGNYRS